MRRTIPRLIAGHLSKLRFPRLFALVAVLFGADLFFPDVIPFVDEILLGLGTALLASWKRGRDERRGARTPVESRSESPRVQDASRGEPPE